MLMTGAEAHLCRQRWAARGCSIPFAGADIGIERRDGGSFGRDCIWPNSVRHVGVALALRCVACVAPLACSRASIYVATQLPTNLPEETKLPSHHRT